MELSDYEARRKIQNREAQRRYRQKQKQRGSATNTGSSSNNSGSVVGDATLSSTELQPVHGSLDVDFSDLFQGSGLSLAGLTPGIPGIPGMASSMASENNFDDLNVVSEGHATHHSRPEHDGYHVHRTSSNSGASNIKYREIEKNPLPRSHDLFLTKVDRMVHDLSRLYDFGVDMQLISPNGELKTSLANVETLFRRSIHKAAENDGYD